MRSHITANKSNRSIKQIFLVQILKYLALHINTTTTFFRWFLLFVCFQNKKFPGDKQLYKIIFSKPPQQNK